ncbi:MAG: hypothetical protein IRY83_14465 [Chloroflexi bacterium]|nr:hypothetical protein [Chloroflexota bacterium]
MSAMVTFQLTVEQFRALLDVLLAPEAPDDLANLVLTACTRPHEGIISVPLSPQSADEVCRLVAARSRISPEVAPLAALLQEQAHPSTT